jgi:hypothetical protein
MKTHKPLNAIVLLTVFVGFFVLTGCGMKTSSSSGNSGDGLRAQAWAPSASPLDTGAVFDVTPQIAVEPDGGGTAVAVWVKLEDPDPFDTNPQQVYRLYAANYNGTTWGSPQVIDAGSASYYSAWSPKVSMDNNGDAIVVWQQHDGTAQRVYARRFSGGSWGAIQQLNDSIEFTNFDAADPAIAQSPTPGSAMAVWSQNNEKDWTLSLDTTATYTSVYSMSAYNGGLYAGMGGGGAGAGDVYAYDPGSDSWALFLDNSGYTRVESMIAFGGKLYVGYQGAAGFGDVASYDSATGLWTTVFHTGVPASNTGQYESVRSMAVYQCPTCPAPQLYIGLGNSPLDADVYRCTACDGITLNDWQLVLNTVTNSYQAVSAMAVYNNQLYIGLKRTGVTADVYRCSACAGDADWTQVFANISYDSVRSMTVHNGLLYIGMGDNTADADVWRCSACSVTADWTRVFNGPGTNEAVTSMISYNGYLYIGLGEDSAGDGDIERCVVCDGTDWAFSRNESPIGTYTAVYSLSSFGGALFGGFGNTVTNGDIWRFSAGWQTVARRFVNGVGWDTADTVCPAGSGAADGICYISGVGGALVQPSESPRVVVDNAGQAIAAFIKMTVLPAKPALQPAPTNPSCLTGTTQGSIDCTNSELHANLFNGSWSTDIDLDPDRNTAVGSVASNNQLVCFQNSIGDWNTRDNGGNSVSCVNVIEYDLAMNQTGQAALLIKTAWKENDDWGITPRNGGSSGNCDDQGSVDGSTGDCLPDGNAFEAYMGEAIVARQFDIAKLGVSCPSWSQANAAACWPLSRLANFGTYPVVTVTVYPATVTTPTAFGIGPFAGGCPSSTTIDGGRTILNCHFTNPRIALSPGGTTAIAVYESYDGTTDDIQAHNYDGATWGAFATIDAGGGDAHAPQIAMDNSGFGVAVWTQSDGAIFRVNSNCFAPSTGVITTCGNVVATGWQGAAPVDNGVGSESGYFNPVVGLPGPGGPSSALSLFIGWSVADNSTRLYYATGP